MASLSETIPEGSFVPLFNNVRKEVVATSMKELERNKASDVSGISMFIWDEMVHRGLVSDPFKIASTIDNDYEGIYEFVTAELGRDPVSDAYAVSYFNELDNELSFVDVTVVQCFPNDLHIADVEFADNRRPVGQGKPEKGFRNFHGLHIFGEFIERAKMVARSRDVERLSLLVASRDLYPVFSRHGFAVSDTQMAQAAFNGPRVGFPMILKV